MLGCRTPLADTGARNVCGNRLSRPTTQTHGTDEKGSLGSASTDTRQQAIGIPGDSECWSRGSRSAAAPTSHPRSRCRTGTRDRDWNDTHDSRDISHHNRCDYGDPQHCGSWKAFRDCGVDAPVSITDRAGDWRRACRSCVAHDRALGEAVGRRVSRLFRLPTESIFHLLHL